MSKYNNVVFKYTLKPVKSASQVVRMPMGAEVLDAQLQDGNFVIWASVFDGYEKKNLKEDRHFVILFTGESTNYALKEHIATLQIHGLVYHIFEIGAAHNL